MVLAPRALPQGGADAPSSAANVVDIGCGPGTFLGRTERRFSSAVGIDLAPTKIEYARHHYGRPGLEFRMGNVGTLQSSRRFDAAISIEVIEHIPRNQTSGFFEGGFCIT